MDNRVALAVLHNSTTETTRLHSGSSIFRAEMYAIMHAVALIHCSKDREFIIFSDSMSTLNALSGFKVELDLVQNIIKDYTHLVTNNGKTIVFCQIPSHVNVRGNEGADVAAKLALSLPVTNMKLPAYELIPLASRFCLDEWQDIWNCCKENFNLPYHWHRHTQQKYLPLRLHCY